MNNLTFLQIRIVTENGKFITCGIMQSNAAMIFVIHSDNNKQRLVGIVVEDIPIGAGGRGFDSRAVSGCCDVSVLYRHNDTKTGSAARWRNNNST